MVLEYNFSIMKDSQMMINMSLSHIDVLIIDSFILQDLLQQYMIKDYDFKPDVIKVINPVTFMRGS